MASRRRVRHESSIEVRLGEQVVKLRQEAAANPSPRERQQLLERARELEFTANLSGWLRTPGATK